MLEKLRNRKFIPIVSIGLLVLVFLFIFYFFKSGDDRFVTGIGEGPDSGTPKAFGEASQPIASESDLTKLSNYTNTRIKEASDRKAASNVRSTATAVMACITKETSDGKASQIVYSPHNGCADGGFLVANAYLDSIPQEVTLATDLKQTKICIYSLNKEGNGIVSFDTNSGQVFSVGKGTTECY